MVVPNKLIQNRKMQQQEPSIIEVISRASGEIQAIVAYLLRLPFLAGNERLLCESTKSGPQTEIPEADWRNGFEARASYVAGFLVEHAQLVASKLGERIVSSWAQLLESLDEIGAFDTQKVWREAERGSLVAA
jgi:hypothetical protein